MSSLIALFMKKIYNSKRQKGKYFRSYLSGQNIHKITQDRLHSHSTNFPRHVGRKDEKETVERHSGTSSCGHGT